MDHATARTVEFEGRTWLVRPTSRGLEAPGPNHWSDSPRAAWVDEKGWLHLALRRGFWGWRAVQLSSALPDGPVHVEVVVDTPSHDLDPQVVAGLFLYKDDAHEIDVELSEFGGLDFNVQYVVAPHTAEHRVRFRQPENRRGVRHVLDWRAGRVALRSEDEHRVLKEAEFPTDHLGEQSGYRLILNLWLYQGRPPRRGKPVELVIRSVEIRG